MDDITKLRGGRRYYSLDSYLKNTFGKKLYKLSLSGGMSCPNRDGKISFGGCIFCSSGGSGDFACDCSDDTDRQIEAAKELVKNKFDGESYIAYFQAYTNTYAPVGYLERLFRPVIMRDDIAVLSIATRPDCLEDDKLVLLAGLAEIKPVWVEHGLQTIHPKTAELINRGYDTECYDEAVKKLRSIGISVITHMIIGLPHESRDDILKTAEHIGKTGSDGIKLQLLHVLENTRLAEMYRRGEFDVLSENEYISLVADIISILPENTVIHRLTGDGAKKLLIAPMWSADKKLVLNIISKAMRDKNIIQGSKFRP